jgi:hypothetical protein
MMLAVAGFAAAAQAGFVISGTGPFASAGAMGNAGNFSLGGIGPVGANYLIGSITISGTLTEVNTGTYASEAQWNIANQGAGYNGSYQVFTQGNFTGSVTGSRTFGVLQWWNATDTVRLEAWESYDDSGLDANWTDVTFTFNDAVVTNLGVFASGTSFDFDTFTSNFDTEMGLYTQSGIRLADNDDSNATLQSRINAGVLADGAYYLVVGGYNSSWNNYNAIAGTASGNVNLQLNGVTIDTGALASGAFKVYSFSIPAPGSVALLGLAGLCAARRRR